MAVRASDLAVAGCALCAVAVGAQEAGRSQLRHVETRVFADLNSVSERWHRPVWTVMQLGSLGGALAVGAATAVAGQPRLGRRLATVGALAWLGSKAVKPFAQRGRPAAVIAATRVLGREQAGLGYPSGHAAVAVAMALAASPRLPAPWRGPLWLTAAGIGAARMYVGAHLPLDVAGGAALGVAVERAVRALRGPA